MNGSKKNNVKARVRMKMNPKTVARIVGLATVYVGVGLVVTRVRWLTPIMAAIGGMTVVDVVIDGVTKAAKTIRSKDVATKEA